MRALISRAFTRTLTSSARQHAARVWRSLPRRIGLRAAIVDYFHDDTDPYSHLLAAVLPALQMRHRIALRCHKVLPPDTAAAPDAARLRDWSRRDVARLAAHHGLVPTNPTDLAALPWVTHDPARGTRLRTRLGHYLGATLHFEGEWYWGIDRLHHLEARLCGAQLAIDPNAAPIIAAPALRFETLRATHTARPVLNFYCSLRSPYTWLAVERARRLAAHYDLELRLRYLLPMVMRGLPVGFAKRKYILLDTKREAETLGLPFGDVVDPVGEPVERGLAILQHAIELGRGREFLESFLRGVFAEGVDASRPESLFRLGARAGLSRPQMDRALRDSGWRTIAERNREELLATGLWGVPSFRLEGHEAVWGQDRLWMVEEDLRATEYP